MTYVDTPPVTGGLADDDLALPPSRSRRLGPATVALGLLAVACMGFAVGVAIDKHQLPTTTVSSSSNRGQTAAPTTGGTGNGRTSTTAAAGAAPAAAGGGGGQGAVVGQVTSIEGSTLVVTETGGTTVRVTAGADTAITRSTGGTLADIKSGDFVTVQGTAAADGTTTAARIVDTGSTPATPGAGRAPGAGAGATGAGGAGPGGTGAGGPPGTGGGGGRRSTTTTP